MSAPHAFEDSQRGITPFGDAADQLVVEAAQCRERFEVSLEIVIESAEWLQDRNERRPSARTDRLERCRPKPAVAASGRER
jgi:hypothetical protein